jgi:hypothetical protein
VLVRSGQFEELLELLSIEPQPIALRAGIELDLPILDDDQWLIANRAEHLCDPLWHWLRSGIGSRLGSLPPVEPKA